MFENIPTPSELELVLSDATPLLSPARVQVASSTNLQIKCSYNYGRGVVLYTCSGGKINICINIINGIPIDEGSLEE